MHQAIYLVLKNPQGKSFFKLINTLSYNIGMSREYVASFKQFKMEKTSQDKIKCCIEQYCSEMGHLISLYIVLL